MSVPFSSDEFLLKRSLFSSIFGVANRLKQAKTTATAQLPAETAEQQQQHTFDESRQPCSSNRIFGLSFRDQQTEFDCLTTAYDESSSAAAALAKSQKTPACSPTTQLGQQFSDQLQFVEGAAAQINDDDDDDNDSEQHRQKEQQQQKQQHNNDNNNDSDESNNNKALKTLSREQIYAEIVRECNELEKQQHKNNNNNNNTEKDNRREEEKEEEVQQMMMMEVLMRSEKSELGTKTFSCNDQQQLITGGKGTSFSLDLERLIKVVVAHVLKEMKNNSQISLAEAMISTKQKQRSKGLKLTECDSNNAAAARYRQRQKEQKDLLVKELCQLEERNGQLKADIAHAQREIDQVKAELWRRWHN
ncbi:hypothetical protein niasHS_000938 [Heterodera schachtii]|uniref:BZIP domain-containing protein n=1 Tax=Heterodera schachtii TaxID=97005 RepID=A0ABD2K8A8_HETSC